MLYLNLFIVLLLVAATGLLAKKLIHLKMLQSKPNNLTLTLVIIAEILLFISLFESTLLVDGINISFFNIFTLVAFLITLLYISATFKHPVEILGLIILPVTILGIVLQLINAQPSVLSSSTLALQVHILLSLLAYSLLAIAACQAVLLSIQNNILKKKQTSSTGNFLRTLPPLESMEILLFQSISFGFILLSFALFSGFVFLENIFAQHLVHKTVLSILAWFIFAFLLWGRYKYGWRGKKVIKLSLGGFIFLMLSYFGSKFVSELVLNI